MTDREKAIVMAYTGIAMLTGDKITEFYKYLAELYGRPVYTHELMALDIKNKAKEDFLVLCRGTANVVEVKHGKWKQGCCSECGYNWGKDAPIASVPNFCPNCGAKMDGKETE